MCLLQRREQIPDEVTDMDGEDSQGESKTATSVWEPDGHYNLCYCRSIKPVPPDSVIL